MTAGGVWPNLFVVGAAKAGTTSLYEYLVRHPEIFMSRVKEPHFFAGLELDPRDAKFFGVITDERAYLELFAGAEAFRVRGEASTSYLASAAAPARLRTVSPEAKIVVLLRDPVERAYSHYLNDVREGRERRTFLTAVTEEIEHPEEARWPFLYVELGRYVEALRRFREAFDDRVLVLFFEEFVADGRGETARVFSFLGVDPSPGADEANGAYNPYARPRSNVARSLLGSHSARMLGRAAVPTRLRPALKGLLLRQDEKPALDPAAKSLLAEIYRPEIDPLSDLLGREPPWAKAW